MTTAFQFVFDNAESLSINQQPLVGQTMSRDFTVRTIKHGTAKKRFTVKLPDGMAWDMYKTQIEALVAAGRHTSGTVTITPATYGTWFSATDSTTYTIICTSMPQWNIFARNQVAWSGPFEFIEYTA